MWYFCIAECCGSACLKSVPSEALQRVRMNVCAMSYKLQKSWLLTTFSACYCPASNNFTHTIGGKQVCTKAFLAATGISKSRYYEIRKLFLLGHLRVERMVLGRFHIGTELAVQWLRLYANENGDKLPNQEKILLPSSMTRSMVYERYKEEYSDSV